MKHIKKGTRTTNKTTPFHWIHQMVKKSRTPWAEDCPDAIRICWYFDDVTKQAIYEYRNSKAATSGFAITAKLQKELPENFNQKYFSNKERALVFGFFFDEIAKFVDVNVDDNDFFNFTGVTKTIFFSTESYESFLELCEQSM